MNGPRPPPKIEQHIFIFKTNLARLKELTLEQMALSFLYAFNVDLLINVTSKRGNHFHCAIKEIKDIPLCWDNRAHKPIAQKTFPPDFSSLIHKVTLGKKQMRAY